MTFDSTTGPDIYTPPVTPPVIEACGCGAQVSLPESNRVAERLSAFRREHRCLPAGAPVPEDDVTNESGQNVSGDASSGDPHPVAVTGTIMSTPSGKGVGFA